MTAEEKSFLSLPHAARPLTPEQTAWYRQGVFGELTHAECAYIHDLPGNFNCHPPIVPATWR